MTRDLGRTSPRETQFLLGAVAVLFLVVLTPAAWAQMKWRYEWKCSKCKKVVAIFDHPNQKPVADECIYCGTKFSEKRMMGQFSVPGMTSMQKTAVDAATGGSGESKTGSPPNLMLIIVAGLGVVTVIAVFQVLRQMADLKEPGRTDDYLQGPHYPTSPG